jgi:hypothetical protein
MAGWVELCHGLFGEVAAVGDLPFVMHVVQDGADQPDDGGLVWEDSHHSGTTFDLLVHPFQSGWLTTVSASGCAGMR